MSSSHKLTPLFILAALMCACQSNGAQTPAVLAAADAETMAAVKSVLAEAMDRAGVELGPGNPTQTSTISVLPPPLSPHEDRSTASPTQFDIVLKGSNCFVIRRDTGEEFELKGVSCKPADG